MPDADEQMFSAQMTPVADQAAAATGAVPDRCDQPESLSMSSPPHDGLLPRSAAGSPAQTAGAPLVDGPGSWPSSVPPAAPRRRAVDASDLRQCALVQTRMKAWKTGYVIMLVYSQRRIVVGKERGITAKSK